MACSLVALMDANGDIGDGLDMVSIRYRDALVSTYLLDVPGILLCSGENSTVYEIRSDRILLPYTV